MVYASSLNETEQRYSNIERELLSVVFALEKCHHYVYGYIVTVKTDHKPLVSIKKKYIAFNSPCLQRLLLRLPWDDVNVKCQKEKENLVADALSRLSPKPTVIDEEDLSQSTCSQMKFLPILQGLRISDVQRPPAC